MLGSGLENHAIAYINGSGISVLNLGVKLQRAFNHLPDWKVVAIKFPAKGDLL